MPRRIHQHPVAFLEVIEEEQATLLLPADAAQIAERYYGLSSRNDTGAVYDLRYIKEGRSFQGEIIRDESVAEGEFILQALSSGMGFGILMHSTNTNTGGEAKASRVSHYGVIADPSRTEQSVSVFRVDETVKSADLSPQGRDQLDEFFGFLFQTLERAIRV